MIDQTMANPPRLSDSSRSQRFSATPRRRAATANTSNSKSVAQRSVLEVFDEAMGRRGGTSGAAGMSQQARDARLLVRFALVWAPYGGPPRAEILQEFGMGPARFVDELWRSAQLLQCPSAVTSALKAVFPKRRAVKSIR